MANHMTTLTFTQEANKVIAIAHIVHNMDVDFAGISATCQHADSFGPILYPTEFRNSSGHFRHIGKMASTLRLFMLLAQELEDLVKEQKEEE